MEYGRFLRNGAFTFAQLMPRQYQLVFHPIQNAPLTAANEPLQPNQRTTLIDSWVDDTAPSASVLANTFDKFFFRANANAGQRLTSANPWAWNMIDHLDPADAEYWQDAAQSALTFFRAFRGDPYLLKADTSLARKQAKAQKTFNLASNGAAKIQAKINGPALHPPERPER